MSRYLVLLLFPSLLVIACSDNLPTDTNWINVVYYDTALTDNSFLLTGAGFSGGRIDMTDGYENGNGWLFYPAGDVAIIIEDNYIDYPGKSSTNMTLALKFPLMRGSVMWENLFEKDADSAVVYAAMTIGGKHYVSVGGTTEVISTRNVFNEVTGRYSGTLVSTFGDTITITDGRFAVRIGQ